MSRPGVLVINGRFLTQRVTGVQRFARESVKAMDALLDEGAHAGLRGRLEIMMPPGDEVVPALRNIPVRRVGSLRGHLWEQFSLPAQLGGAALVNLCALGPVIYGRQMTVIHDTTFLALPRTFSLPTRLFYRATVPGLARHSRIGIAVSAFTRSEMAHWFGMAAAGIRVCGEGGDHILGRPADGAILDRLELRGKRYFLAVGVGGANKNLAGLLSAFARIRTPDLWLVIGGQRNPSIHPEAGEGGDGVIYSGYVDDAPLRALYENALALVYPSLYEGFGLPPLEAMACGCPVIESDQAALIEVAGGAALHVCATDEAALAQTMQKVSEDAGLRNGLAVRGKARAAQFRWRNTAAILLDAASEI